jgi:hypothetical protein
LLQVSPSRDELVKMPVATRTGLALRMPSKAM